MRCLPLQLKKNSPCICCFTSQVTFTYKLRFMWRAQTQCSFQISTALHRPYQKKRGGNVVIFFFFKKKKACLWENKCFKSAFKRRKFRSRPELVRSEIPKVHPPCHQSTQAQSVLDRTIEGQLYNRNEGTMNWLWLFSGNSCGKNLN